MVNWLLIGIAILLLDFFVGLPLDFILVANGIDWVVLLAVGFIELLVPLVCFFIELNQRSNYPLRVEISYPMGKDAEGRPKVVSYEDRLGYKDITGKKGEKTGAKEWRFLKLNKAVQNFTYDYVYEKQIWFGFKKAPHAKILAVQGLQGEEFYPIKYALDLKDEKGGEFKPVFSGDRALMHHKMQREIDTRNTKENFWKAHLLEIVVGGFLLVFCILQFLTWLQMVDVSKNLAADAGANNNLADAIRTSQNQTAKAVQPGSVAGIPFGTTGG